MRYALVTLYEHYEVPLFIVENGLGAVDILKKDHTCDDDYRIAYLKEYITEMKKAVEIDGVDLILTEGFKHGPWPKIMLHRKENEKSMPLRPEECLVVISDVDVEDCENVFPLDDVGKTAVFLLQYIQQNMQHIENL